MKIKPQKLEANWKGGIALDLHTVSSTLRDDGGFDTVRTELGEALYQLKYHSDKKQLPGLVKTAADFLSSRKITRQLSAIIPVPPSEERTFQPVIVLARGIGEELKLVVDEACIIKKRKTQSLKGIDDPESRKKELKDAFGVLHTRYKNKNVLLFDDLYRSGETLTEITKVLYNEGGVQNVYVLTMTKTRSKR